MSETVINDFSLLCRLFGNLFYREPTDPILASTFQWLSQGNLPQYWSLSLDEQSQKALDTLEKKANPTELMSNYQALFSQTGEISVKISAYHSDVAAFNTFRQQWNMPELDDFDHVALLLLTASWIEDKLDSIAIQWAFFETFLLPVLAKFLGKVEAFDHGFYKALSQLTRDLLAAMADELEELEAE